MGVYQGCGEVLDELEMVGRVGASEDASGLPVRERLNALFGVVSNIDPTPSAMIHVCQCNAITAVLSGLLTGIVGLVSVAAGSLACNF